jgi:group I intron endonuclease
MEESGVYMIQSISKPERIYIGSSNNLFRRNKDHMVSLKNNSHYSPQLQNHVNKYGTEDLEFSVLESGDYFNKNHLLAREQGWYIPYNYQNTGLPYFNTAKIAGSQLGTKRSEESCEKIGKPHIGQVPWNKGKIGVYSKETLNEMSKNMVGREAWNKGMVYSGVYSVINYKPILQYDLNGIFIKGWDSTLTASQKLNINGSAICNCLKNRNKTAGGFIWKYKF